MVTVRPQQILMNTRAKRRTAGVWPVNPLRVGQAARLPAPEQIRTAAQEEHREEQQRDLRKGRGRHRHHFVVPVTSADGGPSLASVRVALTCTEYSVPLVRPVIV